MITNLEMIKRQKKATQIIEKLMKLTRHKKNICVCPILNEYDKDKEEFYQFAFLSHIDQLKDKYPDFERKNINDLIPIYDFIIIYNGIRNAQKFDVELKIINTQIVQINFYIRTVFSYETNLSNFLPFTKDIFYRKFNGTKLTKILKEKYKNI